MQTRIQHRSGSTLAVLALPLAVALASGGGCSGSIGDGGSVGGPGEPGTPGTSGQPGSSGGKPGAMAMNGKPGGTGAATGGATGKDEPAPVGASGSAPACSPTADGLTLRRLTRDEYDNTLRDLLGDTTGPGRNLPADDGSAGFDNNISKLTLPALLTEKYAEAAEAVVDAAWTREAGGAGARVRLCEPTAGKEVECAQRILAAFLPRAWRRPVTAAETAELTKIVEDARKRGDAGEIGVKLALQAALLSPHFLFRIEADGGSGKPLAAWGTASRLSYFLWASMPDDKLMARAADGSILQPDVLRAEAKRMLADPKAEAIVQQFVTQWLELRRVDGVNPSSTLFPGFDADIKKAMRQETELFVRSFLKEDRSALELVDADFTFLNGKLVQHYGLWESGVSGDAMKRGKIPASSPRGGGLLSQGSILTVTSMPDRTSVIHRGVWVLKHLLCDEPPQPPADVPPLPPTGAGKNATLRERTEAHRANPACASCHNLIDPIGFGLESFDAVGKWREQEGNSKIDPSGNFRGKPFKGPRELAAIVKADPGFAGCLVQKVFGYALGRTPAEHDKGALDELGKSFAGKGHRLGELFVDVAASPSFAKPCGK